MVPSSAPDSLVNIPTPLNARSEMQRRVVNLMVFRLVLISLVLGATLLLWWVSDLEVSQPSSRFIYGVIGATYLLTIVYALAIRRGVDPTRLGEFQLAADLVMTATLVHVTGGAQSAYTFFFPLSIIAASTIRFQRGAVIATVASITLFVTISLLGWTGVLPAPTTIGVSATDPTSLHMIRAIGLNLAAFIGVAFLAYNMGGQLQRTVASLASEREAVADLYTLHEDIVRCLSSGLMTVDKHNRVLTINLAASELLATRPSELIGRPVSRIAPALEKTLSALAPRQEVRRGDVVAEIGGEKRVLGLSVSPLRDNQDEVIGRVLNFTDLTELRKMEKQVKHAERLAAIGTLAAGIAHEIRNPLASISGSVELIRTAPDADNGPLMDIITREIDRLNGMIHDLLDYTNPGPRELVQFDFAVMLSETIEVFRHDPQFSDVELQLDDASPTQGVYLGGDPGKLRQVLWNLLRNAAEAAEAGAGHDGAIRVSLRRRSGDVLLTIADNGPGMEDEQISQVFDPFFTTKKSGSGLGLATCHNIVHEHGGTILAESLSSGGASFSVRLPVDASGSFAEWKRNTPVAGYSPPTSPASPKSHE